MTKNEDEDRETNNEIVEKLWNIHFRECICQGDYPVFKIGVIAGLKAGREEWINDKALIELNSHCLALEEELSDRESNDIEWQEKVRKLREEIIEMDKDAQEPLNEDKIITLCMVESLIDDIFGKEPAHSVSVPKKESDEPAESSEDVSGSEAKLRVTKTTMHGLRSEDAKGPKKKQGGR